MQCMHSEVLLALLEFHKLAFHKFFSEALSTVIGVDGTRTFILGILLDVPITISIGPVHGSDVVYTIFCIFDTPGYQIILGLALLISLHAFIYVQFCNFTITTSFSNAKIIPTMPGR